MKTATLTTSDGKQLTVKVADQKFQAVCQEGSLPLCSHRGTWFGPERDTKTEAEADRDNHKSECPDHDPEVVQW